MTTIQLDRPAPQAPAHRGWFVLDLAVRVILLVLLGVGMLALLPPHLATPAPASRFSVDLKAGKVTSIAYVLKGRSLRWADGPLHWYAADLSLGRPALGPSPDGMGAVSEDVEGDNPDNDADAAWLTRAIDAAGSHRHFIVIDSSKDSWAPLVPWQGLSIAAGIAGILPFFLMLGRDQRRFGNRWAWFWVFVLPGWGAGAALYLVLEDDPLWRRKASPVPARPRLGGGHGFAVALLLKGCLAAASHLFW